MEETKAQKKTNRQRGAVIVEATLVLPFFMFAMYTLLSVIQITYTQARIAVALDSATKQAAEYMHVYFVTGMDEVFTGQGGKSSELANQVASFLQQLGEGLGNVDEELGQFVDKSGKALKGDSITALVQDKLGAFVVEQMLKSNLATTGSTGDDFLRRNRVENLSMNGSKFLEAGQGSTGKDIFIRVTYDVRVIRLLNIDYKFHFSHCSYAKAWAGD